MVKNPATLIVFLASACGAFADYGIKILKDGPAGITVRFSMQASDYSILPVNVNGIPCSRIRLGDADYTEDKGDPDMPQVSQSLILPDKSDMDFEITEADFLDVDAYPIAPSKGTLRRNVRPETVPFEFGPAYASRKRFPEQSAHLGTPHIAGEFRSGVLYFQPFQYDFATGKLRIYTSITVRISPSDRPGPNEKIRKGGGDGSKTHYHAASEEGGMLIISDKGFLDAMKPFVLWKNKRGLKTEIADVAEVGDANAIKAYVAQRYRDQGIRYLLLVGDWDKVPSLQNGGPTKDDQGPSDIAYGLIEGDDAYPEMMVGRFSGSTAADIRAQVDKTLFYERKLTTADAWLRNAYATSDGSEKDDQAAIDYIVKDLKAYHYPAVANSVSTYGLAADENKLLDRINAGLGVEFNASHGDEVSIVNLNVINVGKMANKGKYPFNFTSACNAGTFNYKKDCLGEALLKKPDAGFVGAFMASILTPWYEPYVALKEQADVLAEKYPDNIKRTYGGVAVSGCMKMIDKYPKTGPWVSNALILFGDPSLQIYTDQPAPLSIAHPRQIGIGSQEVTVTGTEGATVCLYQAKGGIQMVKQLTGGKASFSLTAVPDPSDTLFITGTLSNHVTYEGSIALASTVAVNPKGMPRAEAPPVRTDFRTPVFSRRTEVFNAQGKSQKP